MNVFRNYTKRSLKANRSRTFVTIIGIVLSMALLTAVIEGAYSGIQFMVRGEIKQNGRWEVYYYDQTESQQADMLQMVEEKDYTTWRTVGWADAGSSNEYKPYILIQSVPENFTDFVSVHITSGRMPQNSSEIMLSVHLASNGGVQKKLGDSLTLQVGKRMSANTELNSFTVYAPGVETIEETTQKTYTVVGFCERLDISVEAFSCPGYTAFTTGDDSGNYGTFLTLKNPSKAFQHIDGIASRYWEEKPYMHNCSMHTDLLNYNGTVRNSGLQRVIYGFATILIVLISFGSVSLIYNSFAISLSERTKQFGLLKSVGATKKQLRASVMYEALILGGIGIPIGIAVGCLGIGITLYCLRDAFAVFLGVSGVQMQIVISPVALLIAVVLGFVVILISASIPAARAVHIPPIEAIRQNADTKIKPRDVKTLGLTTKLFGFEGMMAAKNFRRSGKRYRATVVSLFMSVVLFISASSFCSYLTGSVDTVVSDGTEMDIAYSDYGKDAMDPEEFTALVSGISGADRISYARYSEACFILPDELMSDRYREYRKENELYMPIAFVRDEEFREMLSQNKLSEAEYFNASSPKGLLFAEMTDYTTDGSSGKYVTYDVVDKHSLPGTIQMTGYLEREGFIRYGYYPEGGGKMVAYFPEQYLEEYWQSIAGKEGPVPDPDWSRADIVSKEDATLRKDLLIGASVNSAPFALTRKQATVIYPYSMLPAVLSEEEMKVFYVDEYGYGIGARDHAKVFAELKQLLTEKGRDVFRLRDIAEDRNSQRMVVTIVNVFSYGFIILISLIALANVFNTISTSIMLRRREFAMLKSIGLSERGFGRMMNYECMIYGIRSLLFGLPVALLMTYWIYKTADFAVNSGFYIPWRGVIIAVSSVFIVVFATMLYATGRIRKDNTMDALRNENL